MVSSGGLAASPISQVLLERSLVGWKEIEYEVMRDGADNCITICNMENMDPMGVHTGDSIVVAPSQTLTDKEYQMLRSASLRIIRALGIEGGCNVQFALPPIPWSWRNALPGSGDAPTPLLRHRGQPQGQPQLRPRQQGHRLPHRPRRGQDRRGQAPGRDSNAVTRKTKAAFEPALDYCVVKIPRWPFDKFPTGDRTTAQPDEGHRRGDGHRPLLRGRPAEGRPLPGDIGSRSLLWEDPSWRTTRMGDPPSRPH